MFLEETIFLRNNHCVTTAWMKTIRYLAPVVLVTLVWNSVTALDPNGENVCTRLTSATQNYQTTESYSTRYYTSCGFLWHDRCTKYRRNYKYTYRLRTVYSRMYVCCDGYAAPPESQECSEPICAPGCVYGTCVGPNVCQCDPGYHGPTCQHTCTANIQNCEQVDCTDSSNSMCTKCLYHISDDIKAYNLVNGQCQKICSWRSDSLSCYPGTCGGTTATGGIFCQCSQNFNSDPNCMKISVAPTVSHCSITLQHDSGGTSVITRDIPCQLTSSPPVYVSVEGNGLSVNWQTRYTGPSVAYPYYINEFKVGVISAGISWSITRGNNVIAEGTIDCNLNHDKDDPNEAAHSCARYGSLSQNLQNSDSLLITASSTNGGYLRLNNYDFSTTPTVSAPTYYEGNTVKRYLNIIVDLEAPTHCSLISPTAATCIGDPLDIGNPYTKQSEIEVKWSTWLDHISGLTTNPYNCKVCIMVAQTNVFNSDGPCTDLFPTRIGDAYEAEFQPTATGVYCAILGVTDVAGNVRYARRCFISDDESSVTIVADNPLSLMVEEETLNLLETDAWTTGESDVLVSWHGHFVNQLHIDKKLLLPIEADSDVIHADYDSEANPMGRPLTAIENRNGIVMFEIGVHKDKVGGLTFPTYEPSWESLPNNLSETYIDSLSDASDGDTFGFWVRATDVMGNTNSDYVAIHIDSTPPQFENFDDSNGDSVYEVPAYDPQSGIMSVRWQLLSTDSRFTLSEGYSRGFEVDGECNPTECYCILANKYCYKLVLDVIPTLDRSIHGSVTSALLRVTIKNNALLETTQEMQVITSNIEPQTTTSRVITPIVGKPTTETTTVIYREPDESTSIGLSVGIAIGAALLLLILLLIVLILRSKSKEPRDFADNAHQNPTFTNEPDCNPYSVSQNHPLSLPPAYTPSVTVPYPPVVEKPRLNSLAGIEDEYATASSLGTNKGTDGNATANEIHPTDIVRKGVIVQGNHSVVFKAKVTSLVLPNVAVKSVKAGNTAGEKETILHEIKMMRKLPLHDNIVQLLGFTSTRDPVALVMEYAPHCDLSQYLQQNTSTESLYDNTSGHLSAAQLCTYARHVCSGIQHLQRYKIIHRNLGARNILLGENMVCKITDFGRAVVAEMDGTYVETQEIQLPVRWTAIEGLNDRLFSLKSDIWSFGVVMWEIFSLGSKPYENMPIKQIAEDVIGGLRLTKPQKCPGNLYSIMERCWHNVPDRRPTLQQILTDLNRNIDGNQQNAFDGEEYMGLADLRR